MEAKHASKGAPKIELFLTGYNFIAESGCVDEEVMFVGPIGHMRPTKKRLFFFLTSV